MKNLFLTISLIFPSLLLGQPTQEQIDIAKAEMMYWKLRGRLVGDEQNINKFSGFTSVGPNNEQRLVFEIEVTNTCVNYWDFNTPTQSKTASIYKL
jgi:hypothetical protein